MDMLLKHSGSQKKINTYSIRHKIIKNRKAYFFLIPVLLLLSTIKYFPFFKAIFQSMYDWNGINVNNFIGFGNYIELFSDKYFVISFVHILIICASTVVINLITPLLASEFVFNIKNSKIQNFFKIGFITPMVVPTVVIILLWRWIYGGEYGILNQLLNLIGLNNLSRPWLGDSSTALGSIIFMGFPWVSGLPFLLYLAGLQSIPNELFEAAKIDGVKTLQRIRFIDIPMVSSQMKLVVMYMMIGSFQTFEQPYIMTNGGPGTSTLTPALYLYSQAFDYSRFGYSASIGVILFLVVFIMTFISQKFLKNTENID